MPVPQTDTGRSVSYTHLLGDTLAEIAAEKAGIIKEGSVVVCYPEQPEEAMGPLLTALGRQGSDALHKRHD